MPTLDELKKKWFIDMDGKNELFSFNRHKGSHVSSSTDHNLVTPLIDGSNYMREWHDSLQAMRSELDCEMYHSGWRLENVRTLGHTNDTSGALDTLRDGHNSGVTTYVMASRHAGGVNYNPPSVVWLRIQGIWTATLDHRFPVAGSNHQKFACLKNPASPKVVAGSIDISVTRWDRDAHASFDPDRSERLTHDAGVMVEGPAVADLEHSFRDRWNDSSRTSGLEPALLPLPLISTPLSAPASFGTHSVQVLHTYGRTSRFFGYSWSPTGEFTAWASYLNAIMKASTYIYIEDQYFLPFDWPPCHTRTGHARDTDIIYQLGEAIKRGVKVIVVVPSNAEDLMHVELKYQRDIGANYLATLAEEHPGEFVIASLHNGTEPIYVHTKVMICDDEFVSIGSVNINQRSMTHDGELQLGIVDAKNVFARDFRVALWGEHLERLPAPLMNFKTAFNTFKADVAASHGRVRPYSTAHPGLPRRRHGFLIRNLIDPYAGPPR